MEFASTRHTVLVADSRDLDSIRNESVDLIITSPPYPMIAMWDELFGRLAPEISRVVSGEMEEADALRVHELMHLELDKVWRECYRALRQGGILCVNVGDATRSVGGRFRLYPNHTRIVSACIEIGLEALPLVLWRKQTNAPNKFMGSGMYPPGAYVTLEHEYVLIFRKDGKRAFTTDLTRRNRRESAYFWEERNLWFSDVWDFKGSRQAYKGASDRDRSAAFPIELAFRLVSMFSVRGDTVFDPFLGTGTTLLAAAAAGRNGVGVEIDPSLAASAIGRLRGAVPVLRELQRGRAERHLQFVEERVEAGRPCAYRNRHHGFPVVTSQEVDLRVDLVRSIEPVPEDYSTVLARYESWND